VRSREDRTRIRVLRLCSVFEPPPSALVGKGVGFDPIGGMQNHTAELTRALDRRGVVQTVLTTRPPTAPYFQRLGDHARVIRLGFPVIPSVGRAPGCVITCGAIPLSDSLYLTIFVYACL